MATRGQAEVRRSGWVRAGVLGLAVASGLALTWGPVATTLARVPEPEPVARKWQLEFKAGAMRVATVDIANVGPRKFFYMTYKVTNNTGEDILFAPIFDLGTGEGEVLRSGRDVPAEATKAIMDMLENPLLQDQISVLGQLSQGEGGAREGLVVWPATDMDLDHVTVYASGLSGETRAIEVLDPETKKTKRALLRKSMMIKYRIPGEIGSIGNTALDVVEQRWILR